MTGPNRRGEITTALVGSISSVGSLGAMKWLVWLMCATLSHMAGCEWLSRLPVRSPPSLISPPSFESAAHAHVLGLVCLSAYGVNPGNRKSGRHEMTTAWTGGWNGEASDSASYSVVRIADCCNCHAALSLCGIRLVLLSFSVWGKTR